ncbi:unnamed protein product [Ceutorhynchus assimilis]|uniref:One cut domain family member n=1 Tax=Ceutorhynchus assimilis TaxID=467358 RepID=A0A9P0DK66_9CUCU|nr:unnamed protein product [Ceutorhynchus assimilis]
MRTARKNHVMEDKQAVITGGSMETYVIFEQQEAEGPVFVIMKSGESELLSPKLSPSSDTIDVNKNKNLNLESTNQTLTTVNDRMYVAGYSPSATNTPLLLSSTVSGEFAYGRASKVTGSFDCSSSLPVVTLLQQTPSNTNQHQSKSQQQQMNIENKFPGSISVLSISSDEEDINTKEIAQRILAELKTYGITQAVFAKRILGRTQGTLSALLQNPKPWSKLDFGKEIFRTMWRWLQKPEGQKMSLSRAQGNKTSCKQKVTYCTSIEEQMPTPKKRRFIFTDLQKRALQAIFKETQRPSKELQETAAMQLGLEPEIVQNFFMNARRRKWKNEERQSAPMREMSPKMEDDSGEDERLME